MMKIREFNCPAASYSGSVSAKYTVILSRAQNASSFSDPGNHLPGNNLILWENWSMAQTYWLKNLRISPVFPGKNLRQINIL